MRRKGEKEGEKEDKEKSAEWDKDEWGETEKG